MPLIPGGQDEGDEYTKFVLRSDRAKLYHTNSILDEAQKITPEAAARVVRLQLKTGAHPYFLAEKFQEIEDAASRPDFDLEKFVRESPVTADYVRSSPYYAAMSNKDILNGALPNLEKMLRRPKHLWPKPDALIEKDAEQFSAIREERESKRIVGNYRIEKPAATSL